ncbi:MAG: replication factor C large subunit [archaeon]|nr:replication factor C large subunit [archaeon]
MAAEDWTEKYRPQSLKDIVGNPSSAAAMKQWAESWQKGVPQFRALVLMGSPGIGKTSSAEALAREMGWEIVEMNASDQRTGTAIENIAVRAGNFNTFGADGSFHSTRDGEMKLIVLDEADSLYGNADRGAMPAITKLIRNTRQPVILICNDFYEMTRKSSIIKTDTLQIQFRKPQARSIETVIKRICARERVIIADEAVAKIAENADGDLRAAIRDLQSLAMGHREITSEMADVLSERESRSDMFQFMSALFRKRDAAYAKQLLRECDVEPATVALWIEENIPTECANKREMAECFDALSRADVYLGRVSKRMYYGLWSYANDLMVDGIINALKSPKISFDRIRFPMYLSKMSRSKSTRAMRKSVAMKLGAMIHTSSRTILNESLTFFVALAKQDQEFRVMLVKEGGLEEDELGFLIEAKPESKIVKDTFKLAFPPEPKAEKKKAAPKAKKPAEPAEFKMPEKKAEPAPKVEEPKPVEAKPVETPKEEPVKTEVPQAEPAKTQEPAPAPEPKAKPKQRSLFDF